MDRTELYLLRLCGATDAREEAADSSHSDITEGDLGEVPGVDLATLRRDLLHRSQAGHEVTNGQ